MKENEIMQEDIIMPTVSIIVPVYNAEHYINRCVDSILAQEYTDYELILVDDGSRDASGSICDEYAAKDARVRVIHKENTGVSDTRNIGINEAAGAYLQFLDSDDWITPDATKLLVRAATEHNCDLVIADFYRVIGERVAHKGDIDEDGVLTKEEFAAHMMENPADFYYGVLWNKLYRRDLIEKYRLRMDTSVSWCEDFLFNLEYILHADVFYALQAPIYYYVKTKGSLASQGMSITKTIKMKLMVFEYYNNFYKNVYDEKDYEKKRLQVYRFFLDAAGDGGAPLAILPGGKKLGEERTAVYSDGISGDGTLMEFYRNRKLLEHYLEVAALQYDLTLPDVTLLLSLSQLHTVRNRKELADYTGLSMGSLSRSLQKLLSRDLIKLMDVRVKSIAPQAGHKNPEHSTLTALQSLKSSEKYLQVELLPAAEPVLSALAIAQNDFDAARFADFSEEELIEYTALTQKIRQNSLKILQP